MQREKDIDHLDDVEACIETSHNELMRFLGEKIMMTYSLTSKISLETITKQVVETCDKNADKWLSDVKEETKEFLIDYQEKDRKMQNLDFDEEFIYLDKKRGLRVIVWFMMWLAKIHVKSEFIPDLSIITSRIWKTLEEANIEVQDLDNKIIWKMIVTSCEKLLPRLPMFKGDSALLTEFVKQSCQLIGKVFEDKTL